METRPCTSAPRSLWEKLQKQPSHDTLSVDSGDVERQLTSAGASVLTARYANPYQVHGSVGGACAVADVRSGEATVWLATQSANPTRSIVAILLNLPPGKVRVIYVRGSGCYGLGRQDERMWENSAVPFADSEHVCRRMFHGRALCFDEGRSGGFRLGHLTNERIIGVRKAAAKAASWQTNPLAAGDRSRTGEVSGRGIACVDYEGGNGDSALVSSRARVEEVTWDSRRVTSVDRETYSSLDLDYEMLAVECVLVTPDGVPVTDAGETAITVVPAAIGNGFSMPPARRLRATAVYSGAGSRRFARGVEAWSAGLGGASDRYLCRNANQSRQARCRDGLTVPEFHAAVKTWAAQQSSSSARRRSSTTKSAHTR